MDEMSKPTYEELEAACAQLEVQATNAKASLNAALGALPVKGKNIGIIEDDILNASRLLTEALALPHGREFLAEMERLREDRNEWKKLFESSKDERDALKARVVELEAQLNPKPELMDGPGWTVTGVIRMGEFLRNALCGAALEQGRAETELEELEAANWRQSDLIMQGQDSLEAAEAKLAEAEKAHEEYRKRDLVRQMKYGDERDQLQSKLATAVEVLGNVREAVEGSDEDPDKILASIGRAVRKFLADNQAAAEQRDARLRDEVITEVGNALATRPNGVYIGILEDISALKSKVGGK